MEFFQEWTLACLSGSAEHRTVIAPSSKKEWFNAKLESLLPVESFSELKPEDWPLPPQGRSLWPFSWTSRSWTRSRRVTATAQWCLWSCCISWPLPTSQTEKAPWGVCTTSRLPPLLSRYRLSACEPAAEPLVHVEIHICSQAVLENVHFTSKQMFFVAVCWHVFVVLRVHKQPPITADT